MKKICGVSKGRMEIISMNMPYRKKKCLAIYDYHRNAYVKVASFNNDCSADEFIEYLISFCGAVESEVSE